MPREHGSYVIHDFAYAELGFDGYRPPSILQVEGAAEHCIEIYSMTKSYNMAGWRVGFCLGNRKLIAALARIKSYLDYGIFQPIQIASIIALRECNDAPAQISSIYQGRRDVLCEGLNRAGWPVTPPKASMFVWARIPEPYPRTRFAGICQAFDEGSVRGGIAWNRVRPHGRGLRAFQLD